MTTTALLPAKEVEQTNKQVEALSRAATALTLKSPADVETAGGLLETVKTGRKAITSRKEEITRPLMQSLASIRDLFKPLELTLENAEKVVKAKVIAFQTLEEAKIAEAKAKILARAEKGTLRTDTALKKLEEVGTVTKTEKMQTRTLTKVRVIDETLIPREYLSPNMMLITEAVLRRGESIPGVETYKEKIIAV